MENICHKPQVLTEIQQEVVDYFGDRIIWKAPGNVPGVYCFLTPSGKIYVGCTERKISRRKFEHLSGNSRNKHLVRTLKRNWESGNVAFFILKHEGCVFENERVYIKECFDKWPYSMMNVSRGGKGPSGKELGNRIRAGLFREDENGVTPAKKAGQKSAVTKTKKDPKTGLSIAQKAGKKISESFKKLDENGVSISEKAAKRAGETKRIKVDEETGLSLAQSARKKQTERMKLVDPETGLTGHQLASVQRKKTMSQIDPETGMTLSQLSKIKGDETKRRKKESLKKKLLLRIMDSLIQRIS